ncbi:DNA-deoxyinosine glycosylase [Novosphingobium piscinae]|uniref:DNA-deoxyinosine glycosylase n=1 Tax=Novosphingobium piscinae TaxID=1507448 RepID=UPI0031B59B31
MVTPATRLLILGSLPGEASLAAGRYYAHPRNQFWHLAGAVIGDPALPERNYADRLSALGAAGIGMWDTIAAARRRGSLDSAIRDAETAPLRALTDRLTMLRGVAFNGATAARIGRAALAGSGLALIDLPSSSPAHAAVTLAQKRERWMICQDFLA